MVAAKIAECLRIRRLLATLATDDVMGRCALENNLDGVRWDLIGIRRQRQGVASTFNALRYAIALERGFQRSEYTIYTGGRREYAIALYAADKRLWHGEYSQGERADMVATRV